ncbi:MAG: hypothetical protein WCO99_09270 [Planctomycetota bacterium]
MAGIIIREVPAKASQAKVRERLARIARRLPRDSFTIFQDPTQLADLEPAR